VNQATVTAQPAGGLDTVSDTDLSHYFGATPEVAIEKQTNGQDADAPPGPYILEGEGVSWSYLVTNTGNITLTEVAVSDDQEVAISCPQTALAPEEGMTCTAAGTASVGLYLNVGTVTTAEGALDSDPSHYTGLSPDPAIDVQKLTNGHDADRMPGPYVGVGDTVVWEYLVTNVGNITLTQVAVTDSDPLVVVSCPEPDTLAPREGLTCSASRVASAGQYTNTGTATAEPAGGGETVSDSDLSHYFGSAQAIVLQKHTNGQDADLAPGPYILAGQPVTWTYVVTNEGNLALSGVSVSDDQNGPVSCPKTALQVQESMSCLVTGTAVSGQYTNTGTVTGTPPAGLPPVSDSDRSHYYGVTLALSLEKATDGQDADVPPGPTLEVEGTVTWTYVVRNEGNVALTGVSVTDDREGTVTCPQTTLAAGASMTCTTAGVAVEGPYANLGTATAYFGDTGLQATDPSHYLGQIAERRVFLPAILR
jgi:hypothetical protein